MSCYICTSSEMFRCWPIALLYLKQMFSLYSCWLIVSFSPLPVRHPSCFHDDSERFLSDILLPNLVWHAGRIAAAVRTSALSCLLAVLHGGAITPGQVFTEGHQQIHHMYSMMRTVFSVSTCAEWLISTGGTYRMWAPSSTFDLQSAGNFFLLTL